MITLPLHSQKYCGCLNFSFTEQVLPFKKKKMFLINSWEYFEFKAFFFSYTYSHHENFFNYQKTFLLTSTLFFIKFQQKSPISQTIIFFFFICGILKILLSKTFFQKVKTRYFYSIHISFLKNLR